MNLMKSGLLGFTFLAVLPVSADQVVVGNTSILNSQSRTVNVLSQGPAGLSVNVFSTDCNNNEAFIGNQVIGAGGSANFDLGDDAQSLTLEFAVNPADQDVADVANFEVSEQGGEPNNCDNNEQEDEPAAPAPEPEDAADAQADAALNAFTIVVNQIVNNFNNNVDGLFGSSDDNEIRQGIENLRLSSLNDINNAADDAIEQGADAGDVNQGRANAIDAINEVIAGAENILDDTDNPNVDIDNNADAALNAFFNLITQTLNNFSNNLSNFLSNDNLNDQQLNQGVQDLQNATINDINNIANGALAQGADANEVNQARNDAISQVNEVVDSLDL